ncbi:hypothetical protein TNCV_4625321 [Trichonephila clavipes]|nr:hypothetical protein TNCV_4625321 [Trichonephila clavipes]
MKAVAGLVVRADRKVWVRCPMPPNTLRVHTEYVLVKSVGGRSSNLVGGRSSNHECRGLKNISFPFSSLPKLWRWRSVVSPSIVKIYRPFVNFTELNQTILVWCSRQRPTTGVHLAPCPDGFCGSPSDSVRQVALETTTCICASTY